MVPVNVISRVELSGIAPMVHVEVLPVTALHDPPPAIVTAGLLNVEGTETATLTPAPACGPLLVTRITQLRGWPALALPSCGKVCTATAMSAGKLAETGVVTLGETALSAQLGASESTKPVVLV